VSLNEIVERKNSLLESILGGVLPVLNDTATLLFNYNNLGPLVIFLKPTGERHIMLGHRLWNFGFFHFGFYTDYGFSNRNLRTGHPEMFYAGTDLKKFETAILSSMISLADHYEIPRGFVLRARTLFRRVERGGFRSFLRWRIYTPTDYIRDIQRLASRHLGSQSLAPMRKEMVKEGIYYTPLFVNREFASTLEPVRGFLLLYHRGLETDDFEKYLIGMGFERYFSI